MELRCKIFFYTGLYDLLINDNTRPRFVIHIEIS